MFPMGTFSILNFKAYRAFQLILSANWGVATVQNAFVLGWVKMHHFVVSKMLGTLLVSCYGVVASC